MEKSLLYITLALICIYLIVDSIMGKDMVGTFLASLFPSVFT